MPDPDQDAGTMLLLVENICSNVFSSSTVPRTGLPSIDSCEGQAQAGTEAYSANVNVRAVSIRDEDYVLPCTLLLLEAISASVEHAATPVSSVHTSASTVTVGHNLGLQKLLLHHVRVMVKLCQQSSGHFNRTGNTWDIQPEAFRYVTDIVLCGRLAFLLQKQTDWSGLIQALDVNYKTVSLLPPA